jgi:cytosine/uracil/thiamine/allantoin permease
MIAQRLCMGMSCTLAADCCSQSCCCCCCFRYAVSQRAQAVGQAVGLPTFMAIFSFIGEIIVRGGGVVVTSKHLSR